MSEEPKYKIKPTSTFKKELKLSQKRHLDLTELEKVIDLLAKDDTPLPEEYKDHDLHGNYKEFRECHILNDWLLVYKKSEATLYLYLSRVGTHSDLFGKNKR